MEALKINDSQDESYIQVVKNCLLNKSDAIKTLADKVGGEVDRAVDLISQCNGRVIVSGMGKSGIIGKKIAATLASTGTPSFFIHPGEAFHGDLGMIVADDVLLLISNSGETEEVNKLIPSLKRFGNKIISITNSFESTLAKNSDVALNIFVEREVCPNNLAPTTSTTITLALADSLAVALMKAKDFKPEQFAVYHPGGSLGRKLLSTVKDEMVSVNLPLVEPTSTFNEVVLKMTQSKLGMAIVMDGKVLKGVISDGDLRRSLLSEIHVNELEAKDMMTTDPIFVAEGMMLSEAEMIMKENRIQWLLVSDENNGFCGVVKG